MVTKIIDEYTNNNITTPRTTGANKSQIMVKYMGYLGNIFMLNRMIKLFVDSHTELDHVLYMKQRI